MMFYPALLKNTSSHKSHLGHSIQITGPPCWKLNTGATWYIFLDHRTDHECGGDGGSARQPAPAGPWRQVSNELFGFKPQDLNPRPPH